MLNHSSFSAWIMINGKVAEEYNVEKDETGKVTCWIPSEAGKNFEVHFKDALCQKLSDAIVSIDGNRCGGRVMRKRARASYSIKGIDVSTTSIRPFVFSNLSLTDEDDDLASASSSVGEIEVKIRHIRMKGYDSKSKTYSVPTEQKYNEKAKKGIDHQTVFGDAVQSRGSRSVKVTPMKDVVRFCFRYRPLEVLRAHGIAPSAPAASSSRISPDIPPQTERDLEDTQPRHLGTIVISDDEDEELERRRRKKIKREQIKTENLPMGGDFIDLT